VLKMPAHLSRLSAGSEHSADLVAGQRAGSDALPVGIKLWSDLVGLRGHWGLDV
jgi:hypothetical protein